MKLGLTFDALLPMSLERLELITATHERVRARELLELVQGFAVAQGGDKSAWRQFQQRLIERAKGGTG